MSAPAAIGPQPGSEARSRVWIWAQIFALLKEFWLANPLAWIATVGLQLSGNARGALYVLGTGGVVGALAEGTYRGHSALFWIWVFIAGSALEELYWTIYPVLQTYLTDHGLYRIQRRVLERAAAAPLIQFEEGPFFDHLQRASNDMGGRLMSVWQQIAGLLRVISSLVAVAAVLFVVHPLLLPILAAGVAPSFWLQARVATAVYQVQRAHTTRDRIRGHLEGLLTGRGAAQELRLFGSADYLFDRWWRLRHERRRDYLAAEERRTLATVLGDLAAGVFFAGGLVLVVALILGDRLTVGDYVMVAGGAAWFQGSLRGLVYSLRGMEEQSQFLGDLFDFWRIARSEPTEPGGAAVRHGSNRRPPPPAQDGRGRRTAAATGARGVALEAERLTFTYPTGSRPVLHDVSLRIAPGERIAIVGENGAGKTTLVKLLTGLYQPDSGVVRLDGVPLDGARAVAVRRRIAAVFQDYASYPLTLRENVGFGDLSRVDDEPALIRAVERAGIRELLNRLPDGLDGYLGREFGETDLSGGQWQRVALARAFFRDADLLVLDEPTAALDPLAELALFERFIELVQGRTAIMISHRLGAARLADRVIVMRDGRIVEEGHHDALVAKGGEYAGLFAAQAQWYR